MHWNRHNKKNYVSLISKLQNRKYLILPNYYLKCYLIPFLQVSLPPLDGIVVHIITSIPWKKKTLSH